MFREHKATTSLQGNKIVFSLMIFQTMPLTEKSLKVGNSRMLCYYHIHINYQIL